MHAAMRHAHRDDVLQASHFLEAESHSSSSSPSSVPSNHGRSSLLRTGCVGGLRPSGTKKARTFSVASGVRYLTKRRERPSRSGSTVRRSLSFCLIRVIESG